VIGRSAMSDGAISPEATRAFSQGAFIGNFPINTGECSLTSKVAYHDNLIKGIKSLLEIMGKKI